MKKNYITPKSKVIVLESEALLQANSIIDRPGGTQLGKKNYVDDYWDEDF